MVSVMWRINVATMFFFIALQIVVPLIPRYALVFNASPFLIGFSVSAISLTAIFLRPIFGIASDRWPRSSLMVFSAVVASIAYMILSLALDVYFIVLARVIEGVAAAAFIPLSIASVIDQAHSGRVGEALG